MRGKGTSESPMSHMRRTLPLVSVAALVVLLATCAVVSAVSLKPNTPASDADTVYRGGPDDEYPSAVDAGYFDGDPFEDVLMCSWVNNSCWLFYGGASASNLEREGDVVFVGPQGGFGGSATFLGDINGDGIEDLGIGAPWTAGVGGATQGGSLWIFFGHMARVNGSVGYYDADLVLFSARAFAAFGASACEAGDVNGDNIDDFWVSSPFYEGTSGTPGTLFLFLGSRSLPSSMNETAAAQVITGIVPPGSGGLVLLGGQDLNRDGRPDLVVASASYRDASGVVAGAAYVFLGPLVRADPSLNPGDAEVQIWGSSSVPSLGASMAFAKSFTRGGAPTLMLGADYRIQTPGAGGAVYLFNTTGFACCKQLYPWDADGLIYSTTPGDGAGKALAVGDFDGDGLDDLAVGAPTGFNTRNQSVGRVYLFYGNVTGRAPVLVSNATGWVDGVITSSQFGRHVVSLNFNDDGKADLLVGAPQAREQTGVNGAAYSFFGRLRNRAPTVSIDVTINATEGEVFFASVNQSDLDDDRVSWRWDLGPGAGPGDYTNDTTVELRYADDGTYTIYVSIFDGEYWGYAEATIVIANLPPACEVIPLTGFTEGSLGRLRVNMSDPGNDDLSHSWFGPEGLYHSGIFANYTPPRGQDFEVRVGVLDDDGGQTVCSLLVTVFNVPPTITISAPGAALEGETVPLVMEVSDPGGPDEYTLSWITPEGNVSGPSLEWHATRPGFFEFTAVATDIDGGRGTATLVMRVIGRAPQVDLIIPDGVYEGDAVNLSVEQINGREYDALTFTWSVCGYGTQMNAQPTFPIREVFPGRFCVHVHVADDDGDVVEVEGLLAVANRAPLEGLRVSPEPPFAENTELEFTPIISRYETSDPGRISFNWTLDGVLVDRGMKYRAFLPTGDHKVTVEATDPDGGVSRMSLRVVVENVPPLISIEGPTQIQPGALTTWRAAASDPSGGEVEVEWEIDGERSTIGPEFEWSSRVAGPHVLRAYARDAGGGLASDHITVEVLGPPTEGAGIDLSWIGILVGASAAFAAGIVLGAYVLDRLRNRRKVDDLWKR